MAARYLTEEQTASFEENGMLHLKRVIDEEELGLLRGAVTRITKPAVATRLSCPDYKYAMDPDSGRLILRRVDYAYAKDPALLDLCAHPRLLGIAESIQGPDMLPGGLALVLKTPGSGIPVPWHRDPANIRVRAGINLGVYLDDADEENGMLYVVPKSHADLNISLEGNTEEERFACPEAQPVPANAGDVIVHSENLLHGSKRVRSDRERRVLYFGCRTIDEQLARGLDAAWIRTVVRVNRYAIDHRAQSKGAVNRGETPYLWAPTLREYWPTDDDSYVELRINEEQPGSLRNT
jgi:ectoine hydroxylase-related dioxygenase (phytanoyl-CoA dioxygenase family)